MNLILNNARERKKLLQYSTPIDKKKSLAGIKGNFLIFNRERLNNFLIKTWNKSVMTKGNLRLTKNTELN